MPSDYPPSSRLLVHVNAIHLQPAFSKSINHYSYIILLGHFESTECHCRHTHVSNDSLSRTCQTRETQFDFHIPLIDSRSRARVPLVILHYYSGHMSFKRTEVMTFCILYCKVPPFLSHATCPHINRRPLFAPCKCSGSIGLTHQDCLASWLAVTRGVGKLILSV